MRERRLKEGVKPGYHGYHQKSVTAQVGHGEIGRDMQEHTHIG